MAVFSVFSDVFRSRENYQSQKTENAMTHQPMFQLWFCMLIAQHIWQRRKTNMEKYTQTYARKKILNSFELFTFHF